MRRKSIIHEKIYILLGIKNTFNNYQWIFCGLLLLELLILVVQLINPYFYKMLVDDVLMDKNLDLLYVVCFGKIVFFFLHSFLTINSKNLKFNIVNKIIYELKSKLFINYLNMPTKEQDKTKSGDLEEIINRDIINFDKFFNQQFIEYIVSCVFVTACALVLFFINWKLAVVSCIVVPVPYIISNIIGKINYKRQLERRKLYGEYENFIYDSLQSWKEIKTLCLEKEQLRKFVNYRHKLSKYDIISGYWEFIRESVSFLNEILATKIFIYFIGGLFVMKGEITIGSLLVFASYYNDFYIRINIMNKSNYEFYNDLPSLKRVIEVLSREKRNTKLVIEKQLQCDILFEKVFFKYDKDTEFGLKNISFNIKKGEIFAIVGKSGSGKTTIVKLLLNMYEKESGKIYFGDYSIDEIDSSSMHKNIGIIMQDSLLFNMTIKENLLLVKGDVTDEEIILACKKANIHDYIDSLPNKYNTVIGEKGVRLSGGQKQRLTIARLFLKTPNTIIFDEATSLLDSESELMIHQSLEKISKNRTVIIIAHRLSSVLLADRILVVDKGCIVGNGNHKELLKNNKIYKELFQKQVEEYVV